MKIDQGRADIARIGLRWHIGKHASDGVRLSGGTGLIEEQGLLADACDFVLCPEE